jgi:hypothetical protein
MSKENTMYRTEYASYPKILIIIANARMIGRFPKNSRKGLEFFYECPLTGKLYDMLTGLERFPD